LLALIYLFLLGNTFYYGRYANAGFGEKPLILGSIIVQFYFNILAIAWLIATITLFFVDWRIVILSFVLIIIFRNKIEDIALLPILLFYNWAEKKVRDISWHCKCGKYKGVRNRGILCEGCKAYVSKFEGSDEK